MMMPPFGNLFIEVLMATSLVSLITLTELTARGKQLATVSLKAIEISLLVLLISYVLASAIAFVMRIIEALPVRNLGQ